GEQFALPEAADSLRSSRTNECDAIVTVAGADPMNLVGVVLPGDRVASVPGKQVTYRDGRVHDPSAPTATLSSSIPVVPPPEASLFSHVQA
ncbi:MAG TPA: hypothetical protein VFS41_06635, partial [Edaphobacter sp.]|nr:hypothetical protein [Edaphobacter sp.]